MKNSKQNVFSADELRALGFDREDAGGFYYFIKYLNANDKINSEALVTGDVLEEKEESTIRFTVNLLSDTQDSVLNRADIQYIIDEGK